MAEAKMITYPEGTILIKEGELYPDMYKLVSGHAEVYVGYGTKEETLIGIIGPQACFGEFGVLVGKPEIYTVVAYSDVLILRITEGDMGDFVQENHRNIIEIMRNMANTMMTMRFQIELLIKEIEAGKKPDNNTLLQARKAMKGYGMYRTIQEATMHLKA